MTWPVRLPVASPGLNEAVPPSCPTSLKSPRAKRTTKPWSASSRDMAAPRRRVSSCQPARPTTNCPRSKACGQINSAALSPTLAPKHAN